MAIYDLSRLSVFLAEDNTYVRRVLEGVLRQFRFGRVVGVANGEEAIDYFKHNHRSREGTSIDLVISDLRMTPIDGLLLLRWIRIAKESPNRFMPFIMLSGAADTGNVAGARDLGVSEFLAKPFSARSVYQHILEVIDHPRPYIASQGYFGPDRRRVELPAPGGVERRQTSPGEITVVRSAGTVVRPDLPSHVWHFHLPNTLRDKVADLASDGAGEIPAGLLEEAEAQLERARFDFTEWAIGYLGTLSKLCRQVLVLHGSRSRHFAQINLLAHELRGQGGTFGYPLLSLLAKMLYDSTGERCREDDTAVEVVKAHIDAMRAVLRDRIAGDGGETGRALLVTLRQAIDERSRIG